MARYQPIEQMADASEPLLYGRGRYLAPELLDPRRDMKRLHLGDRRDTARVAPRQKLGRRACTGAAGVRVADGDGEELQEPALRTIVGRRDQRRQREHG